MNFTRPQVYISKKEDVEKLKRDFEEGGDTRTYRITSKTDCLEIR